MGGVGFQRPPEATMDPAGLALARQVVAMRLHLLELEAALWERCGACPQSARMRDLCRPEAAEVFVEGRTRPQRGRVDGVPEPPPSHVNGHPMRRIPGT